MKGLVSSRASGVRGVGHRRVHGKLAETFVAHVEPHALQAAQQFEARPPLHERDPLVEIAQLIERYDPAGLGLVICSHYNVEFNRVFNKTQEYLMVL